MNKLYSLITFLFISGICDAQNLAPNPDFESYQMCPSSVTINTGTVNNWSSFWNTCDYFNSCATVGSQVSVPSNMPGYQFAHSGNGYCGFLVGTIGNPYYREILGAQLGQPLQTGSTYYVSFYLSLADGSGYHLPMNKQGALFSTVPFNDLQPPPIQNFAHVYTDSIVSDSAGWTRVAGSFIADSAYSYINLGTFFDQQHINVLNNWQTFFEAYYYIDDVCISTDSLTCNSTVGINETKNEEQFILFPNPFTDKFNITLKRNELIEINLYDITGRKIFSQSFTNSTSINAEQLSKGIYIYEVGNKNAILKKGKLVKN